MPTAYAGKTRNVVQTGTLTPTLATCTCFFCVLHVFNFLLTPYV